MENFTAAVKVSCADHETGGPVLFQQWDGNAWKVISKGLTPMRDIVRPMIEQDAAAYAKENKIMPRTC
jgi:branched-chain amino acid transport system substrate-binding protein